MSAFANLPLVIEPAELAERLNATDLILIDLSSAARYAAGHIPGAQWVDAKRTQLGQPPAPGLLPERAQLEALFADIGHRPDATYVLYDDEGGPWAGRFIWLLDVIGHSRHHFLNGGLQAWISEGRELSQDTPARPSTQVSLTLHDEPTATRDYLQSRLGDTDMAIWDVRGADEYRGEKLSSARGGHIPGAINFEWTAGMDAQRGMRIRTDIADVLQQLGITPDKEIITHCQTHRRSGFTYVVAKSLGYPRVKAYAGSWAEWGNLPDTPIER
ncbi:thiosulfate sulfurtransferase [Ectopseudomonas oleovorans]|uniref:Sulfurtransferase n=1 Tax=Ectopseudomonas oleovorans TaxID=301 RepID=A0A397NB13_ECTOL|nr:rhodanese-like domain-containing protein [Pseudomonas oleovorans]RIA34590.1 thiosulfate sulfurtransferase [Pseudomonas oleovorans]